MYVDGGFVQVVDNVVSVLTNRAIPANSLDASVAARTTSQCDFQAMQRASKNWQFATVKSCKPAASYVLLAEPEPQRRSCERQSTLLWSTKGCHVRLLSALLHSCHAKPRSFWRLNKRK